MPGTKRKASFAFPYERPSKLNKRSSSTTVSRTLSAITKRTSVVKPPLKLPKFPSLKASEVSASLPIADVGSSTTPPALRRASTLTLEDESKTDAVASDESASVKRKSSATKPASLFKKSSSFVEEGALVTRLSGLRSGSIVGETSMAASISLTKSLSRKSSSKLPSVPSGFTKLALPTGESKSGSLRLTKSTLISDVDETEMATALDSLKSYLLKEGSKKRSSIKKTASVKSTTLVPSGVDDAEEAAATADLPHDGLMEVAISFDTTGSMYGCLEEVKAKVQDLVQRLQTDIPGIRVAVIAHGDYCDESNYIVKWIDFGAAIPEICDFVQNAGRTSGGDGPECYELVLQRSREALTWTTGSKRVLIMIGDDVPHEPGYIYGRNTYHINWRDECCALKKMNVKVYGVQAGLGQSASAFYDEMARITGGKRLGLKNFSSIFDVLMMICYREGNPEMLATYEQEILDRGERMADDITSLTKTFHMPSALTSASTSSRPRGKGLKLGKLGATAPRRHIKVIKTKADNKPKAKKATYATAGGKVTPVKKIGAKKRKTNKSNSVQKREKLPDACMNKGTLKCITWSKWICAVEPIMPTSKQKSKFVKIRSNHGYGPKTIFDNNFKVSAIYEVAVQVPGSRKKNVVYFRMSKEGFKLSGHWATHLLRHQKVRMEVNNVLAQGCSIYLRRGLSTARTISLKKTGMIAASKYIRDNFDYAWKKYIWRRSLDAVSKFGLKHRSLQISRKGKTITLSDSTI